MRRKKRPHILQRAAHPPLIKILAAAPALRGAPALGVVTLSTAARLVINIMTAVSQWEREAIGERTRDALSHKRKNLERIGNIAYGYRLSGQP